MIALKTRIPGLIFAGLIGGLGPSMAAAELIKDAEPDGRFYPQNIREDPYFDATSYSECIVDSAKRNGGVSIDVKRACELLATPRRCRGLDGSDAKACYRICKNANYFTRNFGECSVK